MYVRYSHFWRHWTVSAVKWWRVRSFQGSHHHFQRHSWLRWQVVAWNDAWRKQSNGPKALLISHETTRPRRDIERFIWWDQAAQTCFRHHETNRKSSHQQQSAVKSRIPNRWTSPSFTPPLSSLRSKLLSVSKQVSDVILGGVKTPHSSFSFLSTTVVFKKQTKTICYKYIVFNKPYKTDQVKKKKKRRMCDFCAR